MNEKQMINYAIGSYGKEIKIEAEKVDGPKCQWEPHGQCYLMTIQYFGSLHFYYWDSLHALKNNTPIDMLSALRCFASDCITAVDCPTPEDVMSEFGYDDLKQARRIWKTCRRYYENALEIDLTEDDLYQILEDLQDL